MASSQFDERSPVFVISVAAELAGLHPQTLRTYDRLGIVSPQRTRGRGRRYSARDIAQLREVQRLSQEDGVNLAGIKRIMELEDRVAALEETLQSRTEEAVRQNERVRRIFAGTATGEITTVPRGQRPARQKPSASSGKALVLRRRVY